MATLWKRNSYKYITHHYAAFSIRYKHTKYPNLDTSNPLETEPMNRLTRSKYLEWMDRKEIAWNTHLYDPSYPIKIDDDTINPDIIEQINETIDTKKIHNIIKSNLDKIEHVSIFGKAIQKCTWLKDWEIAHQIMKLAMKSKVELNNVIFNIFLNCLAKLDHPELHTIF